MRIVLVILVVSVLANIFIVYKYREQFDRMQQQLQARDRLLEQINRGLNTRMVFLHHSVGQNWLNEGDLRGRLAGLGVGIQSATYGTDLGQNTDICHWLPKFDQHMDEIVQWDGFAEEHRSDGRENDIIMFKSCYPNSNIVGGADSNGNPNDTNKTLANYRATFDSLKAVFSRYPNRTFIYVTAPPLDPSRTTPENAARAREFNIWVKSEFATAYRQTTGLSNFWVFDFFDVLSDDQNVLKEAFRRGGGDSHPNQRGSLAATDAFVEFLKTNGIVQI